MMASRVASLRARTSVASALAAGLRPSLHSDYSVSPMQPLLSARTAAQRKMRDGGEVLNPAECVSPEAALKAITVDAAWQIHADDRGTLEVGKPADVVVFDAGEVGLPLPRRPSIVKVRVVGPGNHRCVDEDGAERRVDQSGNGSPPVGNRVLDQLDGPSGPDRGRALMALQPLKVRRTHHAVSVFSGGSMVAVGDQRKSRFRISESRGPGVGVFLGG